MPSKNVKCIGVSLSAEVLRRLDDYIERKYGVRINRRSFVIEEAIIEYLERRGNGTEKLHAGSS